MIKEIPILFQTIMVKAIENEVNPKTQTRRTKGLEEINKRPNDWIIPNSPCESDYNWVFTAEHGDAQQLRVKCPYGKPGDLLWVRETFAPLSELPDFQTQYIYAARDIKTPGTVWKPSIHMPKEAARVWLQITDIKVERLKDITEADSIAEGVEHVADGFKNYAKLPKILTTLHCWDTAKMSYLTLWESINGIESSELNPCLWAITFKRVEKPC